MKQSVFKLAMIRYTENINILFPILIYRIVSSKKISNFSIYCSVFLYIMILLIYRTRGLNFYYCFTKITKTNGENDKLFEAN